MSDADCTPGREPRNVAASFISYDAVFCARDLRLDLKTLRQQLTHISTKLYAFITLELHAVGPSKFP